MDKIKPIFLALLIVNGLFCQNVEQTIKKMAIACKDWAGYNQKLYAALKDCKFICIGEMHGTKEPAEFLTGIAKTFVANNRTVVVAVEIPDALMEAFHQQGDSIGLAKTKFFSDKTGDGRASVAWFRAICECNKLGVKFCFFDNSSDNRDLGMYERLLECYQEDTSSVMLTLSGNIHNRLIPFNDSKTMGCYLQERLGKGVCSVNHIYNGGTMYSKTSEGLKVHTVAPTNGIFSTSTGYDSYYLTNVFNRTDYSAFFYTKTMTASLPKAK